ncbi:MAG: SMC-Scp complex subunit ScpB, partial [Actinobacteria bacterium]|nr:SMC-Scp complex subunit ScpB [Actinomycetota bacterium]
MSNQEIERSIEAILMVVDEPVSEVILAQIIEAPTEQILESLHHLQNRYENEFRGFQLR